MTLTQASQSYNQAVLALARSGLAALAASAQTKTSKRTPAQESHFLCSWMAESLKEKRFSKLVADDLTAWIRQGRSLGAGANLKQLLERIVAQYGRVETDDSQLGAKLGAMVAELGQLGWLIFTETDIDTKLKLDSDGQPSLIISATEYAGHIEEGELIKPLSLYVRGDEQLLAHCALSHGLLLSQGNKKTSLVKHHKAYILCPKNCLTSLALLA